MPGFRVVLPRTLTDATLPKYRDDPMLTSGTLVLCDPSHSLGPWAAGVPANSIYVPNLARTQALALGGGVVSDYDIQMYVNGQDLSGTYGKFERTPKGGLHGIASQVVPGPSNGTANGRVLSIPTKVATYIKANPTHKYYVSTWSRITRYRNGGTNYEVMSELSGTSGNLLYIIAADAGSAAQGGNEIPVIDELLDGTPTPQNAPSVQPVFKAVCTNGSYVGLPANWFDGYVAGWGNVGTFGTFGPGSAGRHSSYVFYRHVIEDLTVSGRTASEASAIDRTAFRAAFGAGGRYNADTIPTDPATIP